MVMDVFARISEEVRKSYERIDRPQNVLVGLSGGADSTVLLLALRSLQFEQGFSLSAVHVNHGLRENAALDEQFCIALCERLEIPLDVKRVTVKAGGSVEATAREARYAAFNETMAAFRAQKLALAHHMDDQAETVLLHLLHGAGAEGLAGMREVNGAVWRPLLHVRREELREALQALGETWREDESNLDPAFTRNAIRLRLLPEMEKLSPKITNILSRTSDVMRDENDYLDLRAATFLEKHAGKGNFAFVMLEALKAQHPALQRRALRMYARQKEIALEFAHVEQLLSLLDQENGTAVNLPGGWQGVKSETRLHLLAPQRQEQGLYSFDQLLMAPWTGEMVDGRSSQTISAELLNKCEVRSRRSGDFIQPFGMRGTQKIKDYMSARGIDPPFRSSWPLLCCGSEVIWVIGVGASEKLRTSAQDTGIVQMIFSGDLPDKILEG